MTLVDCLLNEYGWTLEYVDDLWVRKALALYAASALRHGLAWASPSYLMREM